MPLSAIILVLISTVMHAGWNLMLRSQPTSYTFLRIVIVVGAVGLGPALAAEMWGVPFPALVWLYLLLAGIFQAYYYLGLTRGYQNGDFTVVYPVARAMPILLIALVDVLLGERPSLIGWLGMLLVSAGCIIIPLRSLRDFNLADYWNRATIWILVTVLATVGYTSVDNAAAGLINPGPLMAARYGIFETTFSALFYLGILKMLGQSTGEPTGWRGWKLPILGAVGVFGAYWLILWSYQLSSQTSYVVALRQFSIVIGVTAGSFLFHEPARALRITASVMIAAGVAGIALFG
jgi:drug/metabolite transporter (DMT)-like permease